MLVGCEGFEFVNTSCFAESWDRVIVNFDGLTHNGGLEQLWRVFSRYSSASSSSLVLVFLDSGIMLDPLHKCLVRKLADLLPEELRVISCRVVWPAQSDTIAFYCPHDYNGTAQGSVREFARQNGKKIVELESDLACDFYSAALLLFSVSPQLKSGINAQMIASVHVPGVNTLHIAKILELFQNFGDCATNQPMASNCMITSKLNKYFEWRMLLDGQVPDGLYKTDEIALQAFELILQLQFVESNQTLFKLFGIDLSCCSMESGNLLEGLPRVAEAEEKFSSLLSSVLATGCIITNIEQIISTGQCSESWYDQEEHEYVIVLKGTAALQYESGGLLHILEPGNWAYLPPHYKHRVYWTSADTTTVWMAVFFRNKIA